MWSWLKRRLNLHQASDNRRYRPQVERLESRELPAVSLKVLPPTNASQAGGNQREQSIAVNPLNPNEMVVFSNFGDADLNNVADPALGIFSSWTNDGGRTWNQQNLFDDPTLPDAACCDPQAAWDTFGNLWLTYLTLIGTTTDIVLALSTDGGRTFSTTLMTTNGENDQPALAIGAGSKPGTGAVWLTYATNTAAGVPALQQEVQGVIVTGKGQFSFFANGSPRLVPGADSVIGQFGDIAVGPKGEVVVTYQSLVGPGLIAGPSNIYVNIDPDGFGPQPMGPRRLVTSTNIGGNRPFPSTTNNAGIDAEVNLAWDRSNGPHRGRLYMVYTDAADTSTNETIIVTRFSDDTGLTWSAPRIVNDGGPASRFNPSIAVDQFTGLVGVAWHDTRLTGPGSTQVHFFATASDNGGRKWASNVQVSTGPSDPTPTETPGVLGLRPLGFGDYNKIDFVKGNLQLIWADNSTTLFGNPDTSKMDLAVARVKVDSTRGEVGKKIRVFFFSNFKRLSTAGAIYEGTIAVINLSGAPVRGPIRLQFNLPGRSMRLVSPKATQEGSFWVFTSSRGLPANQVLTFKVRIFNPLRLKIGPANTFGSATSLA